jgi:ATP-binding cassette, subfamily B, bacterial AbcA/BmrA
LLDEATESLDSESEKLVQQSLDKVMKGRTSFVIAHRLSTIVHADQMVVMQEGTITGIGTHEALMESYDFYRKLVQQQFQKEEKERKGCFLNIQRKQPFSVLFKNTLFQRCCILQEVP